MFVRRPSRKSDASAVARRRLAALAAQFEASASAPAAAAAESAPGPPDSDARAQPPPSAPADPLTRETSGRSGSTSGRHAAPRTADEYGRWNLTAPQVTVVALMVAAVVAVAAWWVLRSIPHATPVQLASTRQLPLISSAAPSYPSAPPAATPSGGALATPTEGAGRAAPLIVDVTGKVRRPGIVELPVGARVVDAIRAAGGARPGVNIAALNLARPLVDGEQIVVGLKVPAVDLVPSPGISGSSTSGAIAPVDLNTATQEQLETLPGIGPVTAAAILAWRAENGAFSSVDELLEVSGIGDAIVQA